MIGKTAVMRRAIYFFFFLVEVTKTGACGANGRLAALMVWFPTPLLDERRKRKI